MVRSVTGSGVTESLYFLGGGAKGGEQIFMGGGGGQEDGIALKGAQSKVKWLGAHGVNGGGGGMVPSPPPRSYATGHWMCRVTNKLGLDWIYGLTCTFRASCYSTHLLYGAEM